MATQSRYGEPTIVDQNTFEIKGKDSGKVYGKGANLGEALAIQQRGSGGSAPTVAGRPDLLATAQAPGVAVEAIAGANGNPVMPSVATPGQLAQKALGNLPSFDAVTGDKPPVPPAEPPPVTNFAEVMQQAAQKGAQAGADAMLTAPQGFDNKLLMQKSVLVNALLGERLTPEDLRWLSPQQQALVRESGPGGKANIEAAIAGLNTIFQGRKDLRKEEEDKANAQFQKFLDSGVDPSTVSPEFLADLDKRTGMPEGFHASYLASDYEQDQVAKQAAELETANKILEVQSKLPVGKSVTIAGVRYDSINQGDIVTGTETDNLGNMYLWSHNKDTGETTTTKLGNFGSQNYTDIRSNEGALLRVFDDGTKRLMFDPRQPNGGIAKGGLVELFPEGSVTPFTRENDPNKDLASECGAWVNDVSSVKVGNTFESKMAVTNPDITAETAQIGDIFVQAYGTTGHIGIINGKSIVDGEIYFTVSESNWSKVPGTNGTVGAITHTRQVRGSDIAGFGNQSFSSDIYNFGTGAPSLDGMTFGDTEESGLDLAGLTFGEETAKKDKDVVSSEEIAKTTEAKKLAGIVSLNKAIADYRSLIEKYGVATGFSPGERTQLDSAKEAINLALKGAEDLGALQVSDIELITRMIPDVTKEGFFSSVVPSPFKANRALDTLDQVTSQYADKSRLIYDQLVSRGAEYSGDPYVMQLAKQLGISEGSETGTIRVKRKSDGMTGTLDANEFDPNVYEKL